MIRWGGRDRGECCVVVPVGCLFAVMPVVLRSGAPVCTRQSEVASCARAESRPLADPVLPPVQGHPHLHRGAGPGLESMRAPPPSISALSLMDLRLTPHEGVALPTAP